MPKIRINEINRRFSVFFRGFIFDNDKKIWNTITVIQFIKAIEINITILCRQLSNKLIYLLSFPGINFWKLSTKELGGFHFKESPFKERITRRNIFSN